MVRDSIAALGLLGLALLPGVAGMGADVPEYPAHRRMDALGWSQVVLLSVPLGCAVVGRRRPRW